MLQKILIQNFQPHKKVKIELDPKMTIIVGDTDSGKSSLFRALRWVCLNQPRGDSFIRNGSDGTVVRAIFDDCDVTRKLGKSKNLYVFNGVEFKTPGTSVPEQISDGLKISELNFQDQHDGAFWLSLSAPDVSRQLNSIVDLGIIDSTLTMAQKNLRSCQNDVKFCEKRLEESKTKVSDTEWVDGADLLYKQVESVVEKKVLLDKKIADAQQLLRSIDTHSETIDLKSREYSHIVVLGKLAKRIKELDDKEGDLLSLNCSVAKWKLQVVDIPSFEEFDALVGRHRALCDKTKSLDVLMQLIQKRLNILNEDEKTASIAEEELEASMIGVCPICGKEI